MNNPGSTSSRPVVFLVDDDQFLRKVLSRGIEQYNFEVRSYSSAEEFLTNYNGEHGCLVLDLNLPDMDGLELQAELAERDFYIAIIFITGHGGIADSVKALRKGAIDFLEKPFRTEQLIESIKEGIKQDTKIKERLTKKKEIVRRITKLTDRERAIFELLVEAKEPPSSKSIARSLDISHRTVEHHRSRILDKLEVRTVVELRVTVGNILSAALSE